MGCFSTRRKVQACLHVLQCYVAVQQIYDCLTQCKAQDRGKAHGTGLHQLSGGMGSFYRTCVLLEEAHSGSEGDGWHFDSFDLPLILTMVTELMGS